MTISNPVTGSRAHRLQLCGLEVRRAGGARPILRGVHLEVEPGTAIGLCGRSGCGKSTLLHVISGLVPWLQPAEVRGRITLGGEDLFELDPGQRSHLLGTCLDRPEAQLFLATVEHELAAARRLYGDSDALRRCISALGVEPLRQRRIVELSSGQRQRVALAVSIGAAPRPVLLDEPTAHLDEAGVDALDGLLADLVAQGATAVVAEQAGWRLGRSLDSWAAVDKGSLAVAAQARPTVLPEPPPHGGDVVLEAENLTVGPNGSEILTGVDLVLREGEIVLVTGPNGSGKSSLARALSAGRGPASGRLDTAGRVVLMLPTSELQLFARTVANEVSGRHLTREEGAKVLRRHRLEHLAARAPWTLSRGERQRLVHASLDLLRPSVMVIDEPAQGLDPDDLQAMVRLIHRRAGKGRAYLIVSHRPELAAAAHRTLRVADGTLREAAP
jgi:energy-coupling factor transport system ATP-binding protein